MACIFPVAVIWTVQIGRHYTSEVSTAWELLIVQLALEGAHPLRVRVALVRGVRRPIEELVLSYGSCEAIRVDARAEDAEHVLDAVCMAGLNDVRVHRHVRLKEAHFVAHVREKAPHFRRKVEHMARLYAGEHVCDLRGISEVAVLLPRGEVEGSVRDDGSKETHQRLPILVFRQL